MQVTAEGGATVVSRLPEDGGDSSEPSAGDRATPGQTAGGVSAEETNGRSGHGEAAVNTVRGERLEILLQGGEVVEVRVIQSIEGTYTSRSAFSPLGDDPPSRRD